MKFPRIRRLLIAAGVGAVALSPLALPTAPAQAGQVGVTLTIKGAGQVRVVDGDPADGASKVCDRSDNLDDRVGAQCPRFRVESVFEAWATLRPVNTVDGYRFSGWKGCDFETVVDGMSECTVRIGAFWSKEHYPVATFTQARPVLSNIRFTQGPDQGRITLGFDTTGVAARCSLVYNEWFDCSSGTSWVFPEGEQSLSIFALNRSGTNGSYESASFRVLDTELFRTPPTLTNQRTASLAWLTRSGSSFECSLDGAAWKWCGPANAGSEDLTDVRDGEHTWRVRAVHGSWVDPTPATHTWTVDTLAPVTTIQSREIYGGRAQVRFSSDDAVRHECQLDARAWSRCESPVVYEGLSDGDHAVRVRGVDAAGNEAAPAVTAWGIDREPPNTGLAGGPAHHSFWLSPSARFTVGTDDDRATLSCTVDGRPRPCAPGALNLTGLEPGTHTVSVGATDPAGNTDPTPATRSWTVPLTTTALSRSGSWRAVRSRSAFGGQSVASSRKNASLSRSVRGARRVALVVGRGRGFGTVKVYAGHRLLRTVQLSASRATTRQVVPVTTFATPFTGKLRVVVATSGRTVRVEGLGVATR